MLDVMDELAAEMIDEALHRQSRGIAERADRPELDVLGDRGQGLAPSRIHFSIAVSVAADTELQLL
jgi:hypothetical protein